MNTSLSFSPPCSPESLPSGATADRKGTLRSSALMARIMDFHFQKDSDLSP